MLPKPHELNNLASLIRGIGNNASHDIDDASVTLERLDYHGISALINGAHLSNSALKAELSQRKPLLAANEALKHKELLSLFNAFQAAGLKKHVIFKGTALAYSCYEKPWHRPRSDTDIFISRKELDLFTLVFEDQGYQKLFATSGEYVSYQATFGKHLTANTALNLDVHWRISNRQCLTHTFTVDDLLLDGVTLETFDHAAIIPSAVNSLLICCLHRLGHHNNEERLAWLYDIHLLASRLNTDDWATFIASAKDRKLAKICADGLACSVTYLQTAIPDQVIKDLNDLSVKNQPSKALLERGLPAWKLLLIDLKAIPTLSNKFKFLFEMAFPPPDYARTKMNTNSLFKAYLIRAWRGIIGLNKTKK